MCHMTYTTMNTGNLFLQKHLSYLLNANCIFSRFLGPVPHKVSTIHPVNKFSLCLQSFHWSSIPGKIREDKKLEKCIWKERLNISICHGFNYIYLNDNSENLFNMLNTSAKGRVPKDPAITSKYQINTGD